MDEKNEESTMLLDVDGNNLFDGQDRDDDKEEGRRKRKKMLPAEEERCRHRSNEEEGRNPPLHNRTSKKQKRITITIRRIRVRIKKTVTKY